MTVKKATKEDKLKEVQRVPYRCYACKDFDGTFGPPENEHTHVCNKCKELPTNDRPIDRHIEEYAIDQNSYGEEFLACERCGLERDECVCADNPLYRKEKPDPDESINVAPSPIPVEQIAYRLERIQFDR